MHRNRLRVRAEQLCQKPLQRKVVYIGIRVEELEVNIDETLLAWRGAMRTCGGTKREDETYAVGIRLVTFRLVCLLFPLGHFRGYDRCL